MNEAPAAAALVGLIPESTGDGLVIVRVRTFEVPPPGAALTTVTDAEPTAAMSVAGIVAWS